MENIPQTKNTIEALSDDLTQVVEKINRSVVAINVRRHLSSSGVYWRDGIIVTAAHTLMRTEDISVIFSSGQTAAASFAGADSSTDLAVLKVNSSELSIPQFADAQQLQVGQLVLAVGRGAQRGLNATLGMVGVLGSAWRSCSGGLIDQFIGLDLALHPGAGGGPLVDAHTRVLVINTSVVSRSIALTIPVSTVNRVVDRILEKGHLNRGYLGLGMQPLPIPEELKNALNLPADAGFIESPTSRNMRSLFRRRAQNFRKENHNGQKVGGIRSHGESRKSALRHDGNNSRNKQVSLEHWRQFQMVLLREYGSAHNRAEWKEKAWWSQ